MCNMHDDGYVMNNDTLESSIDDMKHMHSANKESISTIIQKLLNPAPVAALALLTAGVAPAWRGDHHQQARKSQVVE